MKLSRIHRLLLLLLLSGGSLRAETTMPLDTPLNSDEGWFAFTLELDRSYEAGDSLGYETIPLLQLPGFAGVEFRTGPQGANLWWIWETKEPFHHILQGMPEWDGPERYFIQYTWNRAAGKLRLYINGVATRDPDARFEPTWEFHHTADSVVVKDGPIRISGIRSGTDFRDQDDLRADCPPELLDRHADKLWDFPGYEAIDLSTYDLKPLYENPLDHCGATGDWVMEGAGQAVFEDGWMTLYSERPDAVAPDNGHIVYWCPQDFEGDFVADWEVRVTSPQGLLIVFFNAMGLHGEDLFDPTLPKRDGTFGNYTNGAIRSYHISYFSNPAHEPGRTTSNLRKNPPSYMLMQGPVGIAHDSGDVHHLRLIRLGKRIQLICDERVVIDYTDDQAGRFGPAYTGGKIGFRQMQWTKARYRNLRVQAIGQ